MPSIKDNINPSDTLTIHADKKVHNGSEINVYTFGNGYQMIYAVLEKGEEIDNLVFIGSRNTRDNKEGLIKKLSRENNPQIMLLTATMLIKMELNKKDNPVTNAPVKMSVDLKKYNHLVDGDAVKTLQKQLNTEENEWAKLLFKPQAEPIKNLQQKTQSHL